MERKNVIFLTVIAIATLLVAVVGATFAYFSTTVQTNISGQQNQASVGTAKYERSTITFSAQGDRINLENAIPGNTASVTFKIANSGNTDIPYNIRWTGVTNNFNATNNDPNTGAASQPLDGKNMADDLVYKMECTGGTVRSTSETTAPTTATASILDNLVVTAGQEATCVLTVTFKETNANQNYNQGKSFQGTVEVTTENISASQN